MSVYLVTLHVEGTLEALLAGEHLLLAGDAPPRVLDQAHAQLAAVAGTAALHTAAAAGEAAVTRVVPQIDPSVPQPVVQSRRRPLLGPSPG